MKKIWIKGDEFIKLRHDEVGELDESQLKAYQDDLYDHLKKEKEGLQSKIKALEEKEGSHESEISALKSQVEKIDLDAFKSEVQELALKVKGLVEGKSVVTKSEKSQIRKFISDNADKIRNLKTQGHGFIKFETKVPEALATTSATNPDGIPELVGVQQAPPTNVNLRGAFVDPLVNNINTVLAAFPYTDTVPKDGDYTFVAEKGIKPQIDFKIETRYAEPVKCAAHEILTDESIKDIPNLQQIATDYLRKKHDLKRQDGILFGDGISPNPTGATVYGRAFVAGNMALCVDTPNFMDVVNACKTDIFTTHNFVDEIPYVANVAMVHPHDFFCELVAAKDGNGLPLFPTASLFSFVQLGGCLIIPVENVPAGKILVCDMKKYNVTNYVPYSVQIGWINDQLITNQFTMVGESRFHAFVKKLDEQAFIYDDIATIKTAIEKV
jgi:HK97 family phage major capsid protein